MEYAICRFARNKMELESYYFEMSFFFSVRFKEEGGEGSLDFYTCLGFSDYLVCVYQCFLTVGLSGGFTYEHSHIYELYDGSVLFTAKYN